MPYESRTKNRSYAVVFPERLGAKCRESLGVASHARFHASWCSYKTNGLTIAGSAMVGESFNFVYI